MSKGFAIVTGAAGGIGAVVADTLQSEGYEVIAVDRTVPRKSHVAHALQVDLERTVSDSDYAGGVFSSISTMTRGKLALLVNNAAIQILGGVRDLSIPDWETTMRVNVLAPFVWTKGMFDDLAAARGSVVNIGSIHARLTKPGFVAYATSKAALCGLTRAMAVDLQGRVRINSIEPAAIDTPMLRDGFSKNPHQLVRLGRFHPSGAIGRPSEVARLIIAIANGEMRFLNGSSIALDGAIGASLLDPDSVPDSGAPSTV